MKRELIVDIAARVPQGAVSRAWGWLARRRRPRVAVHALKRAFVAATGIDMAEAADGVGGYDTLQDLFVRRLRPGLRRVDPDPETLVSPVDGAVGACGTVESGTLMQVKGRSYSVARLLGDPEQAEKFEGGPYATLYLSPRDYHRVHAPFSGQVQQAALIPGRLLPVFAEARERVDELFARNERLITYIESVDAGRLAVVKVGATLVGRITVAYDPDLQTNISGQPTRRLSYDPPRLLQKGAELGAFELGSTVVLLGEPGRVSFEHLIPDEAVRVGQRLGTVIGRGRASKDHPKAAPSRKRTARKGSRRRKRGET